MSNIVKKEERVSVSMQDALIDIVTRKDIDPERLEKFLDLQIKMESRQAQVFFNDAMALFQEDCPAIIKNKKVSYKATSYNYAELDEMVATIRPHLAKHGLSFSFNIEAVDSENSILMTTIKHRKGHSETSSYMFNPMSDGGAMNSSQRRKSALTYAKRAGLENALGLITANEDDDARRAVNTEEGQSRNIEKLEALIKQKEFNEEGLLKHLKIKDFGELGKANPEAIAHAITGLKSKKDKK